MEQQYTRVPKDTIDAVEDYAEDQGIDKTTAYRRLIQHGLRKSGYSPVSPTRLKRLAFSIAAISFVIAFGWGGTTLITSIDLHRPVFLFIAFGTLALWIYRQEPAFTRALTRFKTGFDVGSEPVPDGGEEQ